MGGGIVTGAATSPAFSLAAYPASAFTIYLEFRQFLDVRVSPNDIVAVLVRVGGVTVQTVTKAQLLAAGTFARFDITAATAGLAAVDVRFIVDTVTIPSPTREGWFVDDLRVLAVEV